ncbi:MAG TPA: hypothetical protein PK605_14565, partial [Ignavibacteria bacterium]|nr:hypothetical protein [Ignavibacteria bacterium]
MKKIIILIFLTNICYSYNNCDSNFIKYKDIVGYEFEATNNYFNMINDSLNFEGYIVFEKSNYESKIIYDSSAFEFIPFFLIEKIEDVHQPKKYYYFNFLSSYISILSYSKFKNNTIAEDQNFDIFKRIFLDLYEGIKEKRYVIPFAWGFLQTNIFKMDSVYEVKINEFDTKSYFFFKTSFRSIFLQFSCINVNLTEEESIK